MSWRMAATLLALVSATVLGAAAPAAAAPPGTSWSADLAGGDAAGVVVHHGPGAPSVRLDPATAFPAVPEDAGEDRPQPTGILTFPSRLLGHPSDRVAATITGDLPPGSGRTIDVRGRRDTGAWTEWIPAGTGGTEVTLPVATTEVQVRLVLTGYPGTGPVVHDVALTAFPTPRGRAEEESAPGPPLSFSVFATREGLVGGTTANGHVIAPRDHFVALPSRRALSARGTSDYSVQVCAPTGRCAFAPVWDVGPWNTRDDYWNPAPTRQNWADLPHGVPQAQAAFQSGYNGGLDQSARRVANPAGIDLADGLFWDALALPDNAWVTVDYLWTGSANLAAVEATADVHAAPDATAEVTGVAARSASVPVECIQDTATGRWLRLGPDRYLTAAHASPPAATPECAAP